MMTAPICIHGRQATICGECWGPSVPDVPDLRAPREAASLASGCKWPGYFVTDAGRAAMDADDTAADAVRTEIRLDFDGAALLNESLLDFVETLLDAPVAERFEDTTTRGYHVALRFRAAFDPLTVVALQAILGSDPRRELFNLVRARTLGDAPPFWRLDHRWNTLYAEKLPFPVSEDDDMIDPNKFGTGRPALKIEQLGDADVAIWTIDAVEETEIQQDGESRPKLILTVAEFPELAYWVNVTGIRSLTAKLGTDEHKWIGKQVPFIRATTNNPQTRKPQDVLWIAAPDKWDELVAQFSARPRGSRSGSSAKKARR